MSFTFFENFIMEHEGAIRLTVFLSIFVLMAVLEYWMPKKKRVLPRTQRWLTNWALVLVDALTLRILAPILIAGMAVGAAVFASKNHWGLLGLLEFPYWLEFIIAFLLLDLLIYVQHVASHYFPILWRLHKVHHADRDIDVTTGSRFHPIEIVLSMLYKIVCVIFLGAPAVAVFIFEVILNGSALFNHANVRLPLGLDKFLRALIVTPDMHRVHHSIVPKETNSNYGFFLSVWDRIFSTYIPQPSLGHDEMTIGLADYQSQAPARLGWSLLLPFRPKDKKKSIQVD